MTEVHIDNIKLKVTIGTEPQERKRKQNLVIHLSYKYGQNKKTDNLSAAVDYKKLVEETIRKVKPTKFYLLETLASFILNLMMLDIRIKEAAVRIDKPNALINKANIYIIKKRKR